MLGEGHKAEGITACKRKGERWCPFYVAKRISNR